MEAFWTFAVWSRDSGVAHAPRPLARYRRGSEQAGLLGTLTAAQFAQRPELQTMMLLPRIFRGGFPSTRAMRWVWLTGPQTPFHG